MKAGMCRTRFWQLVIAVCLLAAGGVFFAAQPASAFTADVCMQTNYTAHGKTQSLNCTANDVSVAEVTNISISQGGECHLVNNVNTCTCNANQPVTFTADYKVVLTAQARYDIGIYFATDGDPNGDGALTGQCKLTTLDGSNSSNPINLDPSPDACGDIDAGHNPQFLTLTLTVPCTPGADNKLKLPNCTSWRQTGANDVCTQASDAFPGSPSKCNCSPGFTIDIFVETASLEVKKSVFSSTLTENGGDVTYQVDVKNLATQASVTLDTLSDNLYNNITTTGHDGITATTCKTAGPPQTTIAAGATYTCTFTVHYAGPLEKGTKFSDTVQACGTDSFGHTNLCAEGSVDVTVQDVVPTAAGCKKVVGVQCAVVRYDVTITNGDPAESLTLNTLSDNKFGDITAVHAASAGPPVVEAVTATTCNNAVGTVIAVGSSYNCQFDGMICALGIHTNKIAATLSDNDGNTIDWPTKDTTDPNFASQNAKATATATVQDVSSAKTSCD